MEPFARVPPVVSTLDDKINLFVCVLTNITGPQRPGFAIETHAPNVAQAVRPDLRPRSVEGDERVVGGHRVPKSLVECLHVDANDGAEE